MRSRLGDYLTAGSHESATGYFLLLAPKSEGIGNAFCANSFDAKRNGNELFEACRSEVVTGGRDARPPHDSFAFADHDTQPARTEELMFRLFHPNEEDGEMHDARGVCVPEGNPPLRGEASIRIHGLGCNALDSHERKKSHEAGALDGLGHGMLAGGGTTGSATAGDTSVAVHKLLKELNIFVVHVHRPRPLAINKDRILLNGFEPRFLAPRLTANFGRDCHKFKCS